MEQFAEYHIEIYHWCGLRGPWWFGGRGRGEAPKRPRGPQKESEAPKFLEIIPGLHGGIEQPLVSVSWPV